FQAEDGIRDLIVTGVQTCALPIFNYPNARKVKAGRPAEPQIVREIVPWSGELTPIADLDEALPLILASASKPETKGNGHDQSTRSEERRVGKECRSRRWREHEKEK